MENQDPSGNDASLASAPPDEEAPPSYFAVINDPKSSRDLANGNSNRYSDYTDTATTERDRNYLLNDSGIAYSSVNQTVLEPLTSTPSAIPNRKSKYSSNCFLLFAAVLIVVCVLSALSLSVFNSTKLHQVSAKMEKDHKDLKKIKMLVGDLGKKFANVSGDLFELEAEFRNISDTWLDASEKIKIIDKTILEMLEQVEVKYEAMGNETVDYLEDLKFQMSSVSHLRPDVMVSLMVVLIVHKFL